MVGRDIGVRPANRKYVASSTIFRISSGRNAWEGRAQPQHYDDKTVIDAKRVHDDGYRAAAAGACSSLMQQHGSSPGSTVRITRYLTVSLKNFVSACVTP